MVEQEDIVSFDRGPREPRALEGLLVDVFGLGGAPAQSVTRSGEPAEDEAADVDGQQGRCIVWLEQQQRYVVETCRGACITVPEECVRAWLPPPPEEGGFDLVWPHDAEAMEDFGAVVCSELAAKGFCVVQMFLSERERSQAMEEAEVGEDGGERAFTRMQQEIEVGYMGYENNSKVATIEDEIAADTDEDDPALSPLEKCAKQLQSMGFSMAASSQPMLGYGCTALQHTFVRMSMDKMDEDELFPEALADMVDDADEAEWSEHVQSYVHFAQCRKASILYMVENDGGDLWLYPRGKTGVRSVRLPIDSNRMVIFRHDLMDYSYQVRGRSLALQTWMLDEFRNAQHMKEISLNLSAPGEDGLVVVNPGPPVPDGPKASIMSLTTRFPGEAWNASQYWLMFASGTDTCSKWPILRWECDAYYEEGTESIASGKSYTCHGGFVSNQQISQFDNDFFGIGVLEAKSMVPAQKMSTEVGYSCLVQAGFTKHSLRGRRIGCWYGDVGPDWGTFHIDWGRFNLEAPHSMMASSMSNAGTSSRLSHMFDLKGPISSYDTACSASLVAMNAAHLLMFDGDISRAENPEALAIGVNTLLGPSSFIGNCMATMLSHKGRCFTFNRAADGYQRGEGCGGIFFKIFRGDRAEEENRVCALIGTATNQDGRSASLTAPNGPAQQAVIKKSLAFAKINPNAVSIAECHGTGTALGDPIEVGALMAVMSNREFPICKTSAKSNIAHLEAGAGIAGVTKCIMMINNATAPPNCHFNVINAHLTVEGYPVLFDSENINTDFSSSYCGVSSFGFGGTNSRADVYGFASKGHRAAIRVHLPKLSPPRVLPIGQPVFLSGTWNGWTTHEQMEGGRFGTYTCSVRLGDTRIEQFQLSCDKAGLETIHPVVPEADQHCQVIGPDWDGKGLHFKIDGKKDRVPAGTFYQIEFKWTEERKTVSWRPVDAATGELARDPAREDEEEFEHKYYLAGSWRRWVGFQELVHQGKGVYQSSFRIGPLAREEFQIVRDKDWTQVLHPAIPSETAATTVDVPLCGFDAAHVDSAGVRKAWLAKGRQHEDVTVTLSVVDSQFSVSVASSSAAGQTWRHWEAWATEPARSFCLTGSFCPGELLPMEPSRTEPGVYVHQVEIGAEGFASVQVVVDRSMVLYPDTDGGVQVIKTRDAGAAEAWYIMGSPGTVFDVKLDASHSDRTKVLTWSPPLALQP